jgi:hypothetical protein
MKITKRQLRRIIKEAFHSMSPAGKALANSIKGKFMRLYPDATVGIDGRGGFITVNGEKALDMSQATSTRMSDKEMLEKMHVVYAGSQVDADVPTADTRMDSYREARQGKRPGEIELDFGKDTYNYIDESATQAITIRQQLHKIIKEEVEALEQDLTKPIPIDELLFVDEEGYGAMMFPGSGYSYTVREKDFEAEKTKLKKRYGDDVMISTPDPRYPKVKKLHSTKAAASDRAERQNFNRHQKMMSKRLGREPGLGS